MALRAARISLCRVRLHVVPPLRPAHIGSKGRSQKGSGSSPHFEQRNRLLMRSAGARWITALCPHWHSMETSRATVLGCVAKAELDCPREAGADAGLGVGALKSATARAASSRRDALEGPARGGDWNSIGTAGSWTLRRANSPWLILGIGLLAYSECITARTSSSVRRSWESSASATRSMFFL